MTDQHLSELLERTADRVAVGPAPTTAMVHDADLARRRRALTLSLASAAAVAVVAAGTALLSAPGSAPSPQPPVTSPTPTLPLTGQRLVGVGHAAIEVPQNWGTNVMGCGVPLKDTVVIDVGVVPLCGVPRPQGVESVEVTEGEPRFDFTADQSLMVDGVAAQRQVTTCEPGFLSNTRVCKGAVYIPSMNVSFRAESSTGAAEVDRILEGIQVVPDQVGVPGYQSIALDRQENSGEKYLGALREAGLAGEVQTRKVPGLDAGHVLEVSPQPGEMVAPGSVVTVTVSAEPEGPADEGRVGMAAGEGDQALEGTWTVRALVGTDGRSVLPEPFGDTLRLTFADGEMTGTWGCTTVSGTYELGGDDGQDLRFPPEQMSSASRDCIDERLPLVARLLDVRHVTGSAGLRYLHAGNWMIVAELRTS